MIKFYFKVFFVNFILMVAFIFLFSLLRPEAAPAAPTAVDIGFAFGLFMAMAAGALHKLNILMVKRQAGKTALPDLYSTAQELELNVSMPYEKLFDLCRRYVTDKAAYTVTEEDQANGLISARTPWSWKGYGNTFSIKFSEIKDGSAKVRISSKPRMPAVLLDYGENLGNVLRARDYIQTNAH